jgi:predicted small lipoprotein YifL
MQQIRWLHFQQRRNEMKKLLIAAMLSLSLAACGGGGGYDKSDEYDPPTMTETPEYKALVDKLAIAFEKERDCKCPDALYRPEILTDEDIGAYLDWAKLHNNREQISLYNNIIAYRATLRTTKEVTN